MVKTTTKSSPINNHKTFFDSRHSSQKNPLEAISEISTSFKEDFAKNQRIQAATNHRSVNKLKEIIHQLDIKERKRNYAIINQTVNRSGLSNESNFNNTHRYFSNSPDISIKGKQPGFSYSSNGNNNANNYWNNNKEKIGGNRDSKEMIQLLNNCIVRCQSQQHEVKSSHLFSRSKITMQQAKDRIKGLKQATMRNLHPIQEYYTCQNKPNDTINKLDKTHMHVSQEQKQKEKQRKKQILINRSEFIKMLNKCSVPDCNKDDLRSPLKTQQIKNNLRYRNKNSKLPPGAVNSQESLLVVRKMGRKCKTNDRSYISPAIERKIPVNTSYILPQISCNRMAISPCAAPRVKSKFTKSLFKKEQLQQSTYDSEELLRKHIEDSITTTMNVNSTAVHTLATETIENKKQSQKISSIEETEIEKFKQSCQITSNEQIKLLPQLKIKEDLIVPLQFSVLQPSFILFHPE